MATFVHLTPAGNVPRIRRSGIRAVSHGQDGDRGVYLFPVLPSHTLTHQWLRELARWGGQGGHVAVHVRLDDAEPVLVGHYGRPQVEVPASEAVARRLRERLPHPLDGPGPSTRELMARLAAAGDPGAPSALREVLYWLGKRRKGPLGDLARLASHPDPGVREAVETVRDQTKERTRLPYLPL
ncbi:hypothetical protein [Actinomadura gamaensis]|uniref:Uncharacterized protein n=1 Tax=Actinomadura gamaensis TaxID=1763541 RepID=A0ABV9U7C6_9ACTN